jgi:hypothetical protein
MEMRKMVRRKKKRSRSLLPKSSTRRSLRLPTLSLPAR